MALSVRWNNENRGDCRRAAEERTGPSEHGYLYRLYWSQKKEGIRLIAYPILKITPKCWKIQPKCLAKPVYVSMGNPRYAHAELSEALHSYKARRQSLVHRLQWRLRQAQLSLDCADPDRALRDLYWLQDEDKPLTPEEQDEMEFA